MPIARDESDPTWCLVPSSLSSPSWPVTRCFRLTCCWSCDCYQWHFLQHLDTAAPRKRHMHILPSWLSLPSWPHKHAACCCRLLVELPTRHQPNGIKFNCFSDCMSDQCLQNPSPSPASSKATSQPAGSPKHPNVPSSPSLPSWEP